MPEIVAPTPDEAAQQLAQAIEQRAEIAFAAGMRVAIKRPILWLAPDEVRLSYEFRVLSPGETPARGEHWTIYENREGRAVGRSHD